MLRKPVPTPRGRLLHSAVAMTARQADRMRAGVMESKPVDYRGATEALKRLAQARSILEDRALLRELGLLDD